MTKMTPSKQEILDTAAECFMRKGYYATSIDDVARCLDSTKGRIYHHFTSKIDLFFEVHREGMRRLFDAVEPAMGRQGSGLDVLAAMLRAHAIAMFENHTYESVVAQGVQIHRFGATTPDERQSLDALVESRDRFENLFKKQVAAAKREGSLYAADVSIAVKTLLGGIHWSLAWYRPERDTTPRARSNLADKIVQVLVDGVRPR